MVLWFSLASQTYAHLYNIITNLMILYPDGRKKAAVKYICMVQ